MADQDRLNAQSVLPRRPLLSSKEVQRKLRDLEVIFPDAFDPPICQFGRQERTTLKVHAK